MGDPIDTLATVPPGAELAARLAEVDLARLSPHQLIVVAVAGQRQLAHDEAAQLRVFAELAERPQYQRCDAPDDLAGGHTHRAVQAAGDEVSLALRWTPGRATARVALAIELLDDLPDTYAALDAGHIDADKAHLIAERTRCLPQAARRRVEAAVLPDAATRTRWALDQRLRREVITADPTAAEQRRRQATERRHVSRPEPASPGGEDGMATITLLGPAEDVTALWVATDAAARHARSNGDDRTLDQLRFDLLTGLAWTALETGHLGCCHPTCADRTCADPTCASPTTRPPATQLGEAAPSVASPPADRPTGPAPAGPPSHHPPAAPIRQLRRRSQPGEPVRPADTAGAGDATTDAAVARDAGTAGHAGVAGPLLLGRRRGKAATVHVTVPIHALTGAADTPGHLDGFGPITADTARHITADATLRRLLTDPADGRLLHYGRTTYTPPTDLAAHVITRDRTCRFPTCHHPATDADIDHQIPYAHGGTTSPDNTWALHDRHHRAKTWHHFTITTDAHGTTWWTTPAGHHYPVDSEAIGPVLAPTSQHQPAVTTPGEPVPF